MKNLIVFAAVVLLGPICFAISEREILTLGKKIYEANCTACHGVNGDGRGPAARAIASTKPRNFVKEDFKFGSKPDQIAKTVGDGVPGTAMPPWKSALSLKERLAVAKYVLNFKRLTRP